jgi:RNA ligase (TIGR02306 family)
MPLKDLTLYSKIPLSQTVVGDDVTEALGVIKYEPPIPAELQGKIKGFFPAFVPKTDEERIQNMAEVLSSFYTTEKLDGSSVTYYKKDGVFGVCTRNLELAEGETTQWKLARELDLANKLPDNFAIQGELVGEGIQKNPLKIKGHELYVFNAYNIESGRYLHFEDFVAFCASIGVKTVPVVNNNFTLPCTVKELLSLAEGKSLINPNVEREGIVVRPKREMKYQGHRLSFKAISNSYLLKNEE